MVYRSFTESQGLIPIKQQQSIPGTGQEPGAGTHGMGWGGGGADPPADGRLAKVEREGTNGETPSGLTAQYVSMVKPFA